jgi:hypothetical protein
VRVLHSDLSVTTRYFHTDNIGSIAVITDEPARWWSATATTLGASDASLHFLSLPGAAPKSRNAGPDPVEFGRLAPQGSISASYHLKQVERLSRLFP